MGHTPTIREVGKRIRVQVTCSACGHDYGLMERAAAAQLIAEATAPPPPTAVKPASKPEAEKPASKPEAGKYASKPKASKPTSTPMTAKQNSRRGLTDYTER